LAIVLFVLRFTDSEYPVGIFKLLAIVLSVLLRLTALDYSFGIFQLSMLTLALTSIAYSYKTTI